MDPSIRQVNFVDADGRQKVFDFSGIDAAPAVVDDLVRAFANGTAPGGRWQTVSSAKTASDAVKQMAAFLNTNFPEVTGLAKVTAEVWWAWRATKQDSRWPGQINMMRSLLSESSVLPESTRKAMRAKAAKPRKRLPHNDAYTQAEFNAIRRTASHRVNQALRRIEANQALLQRYRDGTEPSAPESLVPRRTWTAGSLLDDLSRKGMLPSQYVAQRVRLEGLFDMRGVTNPAQALFPSIDEMYCLMVLLVCERGFNLATLDNLTVSSFASSDRDVEAAVHTVDTDKPRRGRNRYSAEVLAGDAGKLWERAVKLTQPCRDALAAQGTPTEKLLIAHRHKDLDTRGPFRTEWSTSFLAGGGMGRTIPTDDAGQPIRVTFQRLRLTEQILSQHARQNTETVSEDTYRRPDPTTIESAAETIEQGQDDAVNHAVASVRVRAMSSSEVAAAVANPREAAAKLGVPAPTLKLLLAGRLDTPTGACVDFFNSPFARGAGEPCPASFFACFACGNSIITPRHLPRLVALLDALDDIATVVTATRWDSDYAPHHARLRAVITANATEPEITQARRAVTPVERDAVARLVRRNLDA